MYNYLTRLFSAISQLLNTLFLFGYQNESICGRCYRESWIVPMKIFDFIFSPFSKGYHCRGAYNQDRTWAMEAAKWPERIEASEEHLK